MTPEKKEMVVKLPHTEYNAIIIMKKLGQEKTQNGDDVVVEGSILLPADTSLISTRPLPESIRFGSRITILSRDLGEWWGNPIKDYPNYRRHSDTLHRKTWAEAMTSMEEHLLEQLQKLIDALNTRHQALIDADKE